MNRLFGSLLLVLAVILGPTAPQAHASDYDGRDRDGGYSYRHRGDDDGYRNRGEYSRHYGDDGGYRGYDDDGDCDWNGQCSDGSYYRHDYSNHDRNRNRNRDRGAFSPGPFRDSPVYICSPYSCNSGGEQSGNNGDRDRRRDEPR